MTVKIFANVYQLMFLVLKLVWIRIEYKTVLENKTRTPRGRENGVENRETVLPV